MCPEQAIPTIITVSFLQLFMTFNALPVVMQNINKKTLFAQACKTHLLDNK